MGKNDKKVEKTDDLKTEKKYNKPYFSYSARIILCLVGFVALFSVSMLFLSKTFEKEAGRVASYRDTGKLDYKVYLKENDFYEEEYLDKNKNYIASLIKSINANFNYDFVINKASDMTFNYQIVGKLIISQSNGKDVLYEKEYVIKEGKAQTLEDKYTYNIKDNFSISYDYYNGLANKFKSTYGVDADSKLVVYVKISKNVKDDDMVDIKDSKQMNLTIPLSQKTLEIAINDTGINNTQNIVEDEKVSLANIASGIAFLVCFVGGVAALMGFLELVIILKPKTNVYDKYVKKMLTEYDRLIVETPSEPKFNDKEIIKIKKFEELLDARDNLKRPIMYFSVVKHQKCYFYIQKDETIYLLTIKASDLEQQKK